MYFVYCSRDCLKATASRRFLGDHTRPPTHCNSLQLQNIRYAVHAFSMLLSECTNIPCAHRVAYPTPKLPTVACLPAVREKLSARLPHKCASVGVCVCVCACKFDASKLSRTLYTSQSCVTGTICCRLPRWSVSVLMYTHLHDMCNILCLSV